MLWNTSPCTQHYTEVSAERKWWRCVPTEHKRCAKNIHLPSRFLTRMRVSMGTHLCFGKWTASKNKERFCLGAFGRFGTPLLWQCRSPLPFAVLFVLYEVLLQPNSVAEHFSEAQPGSGWNKTTSLPTSVSTAGFLPNSSFLFFWFLQIKPLLTLHYTLFGEPHFIAQGRSRMTGSMGKVCTHIK